MNSITLRWKESLWRPLSNFQSHQKRRGRNSVFLLFEACIHLPCLKGECISDAEYSVCFNSGYASPFIFLIMLLSYNLGIWLLIGTFMAITPVCIKTEFFPSIVGCAEDCQNWKGHYIFQSIVPPNNTNACHSRIVNPGRLGSIQSDSQAS